MAQISEQLMYVRSVEQLERAKAFIDCYLRCAFPLYIYVCVCLRRVVLCGPRCSFLNKKAPQCVWLFGFIVGLRHSQSPPPPTALFFH